MGLLVAACARAATPAQDEARKPAPEEAPETFRDTATPGGDTLRGVVAVTGAEPQWRVMLTDARGVVHAVTSAGGTATPLEELRAADHLEVTLLGDTTAGAGELPGGRGFRMTAFLVRAVDGADAVDGLLVREPSGYGLRLMDGTTLPITTLPAPLAGQVGARIFWVGPTDLPPAAYGVLRPPGALRSPGR